MKILVCISKAPDTTSKIQFSDGDTKFDANGVTFIVNPYDEWYALVRALELKEANGGTVTTITVGGADHDPIIRKALAIGADNAVRVDAEATDAFFTAKQIADHAQAGGYDLIFCGKETIDYNGYQVGGMVAELLDVPYISTASKLDMAGNHRNGGARRARWFGSSKCDRTLCSKLRQRNGRTTHSKHARHHGGT